MANVENRWHLLAAASAVGLTATFWWRSRSWRVPAGAVRHVVLVKVENKDAIEIIPAFDQMARGLSHLLLSYERGTQCSHENLGKDLSHAFFLTFPDEAARDQYLVHPLHEEFVATYKKRLQDLCVFDYLVGYPQQLSKKLIKLPWCIFLSFRFNSLCDRLCEGPREQVFEVLERQPTYNGSFDDLLEADDLVVVN
eukprot:symbB.v1.2.018747.t1/scaffold1508.1/size114708/6